jgi:hypothetical protein
MVKKTKKRAEESISRKDFEAFKFGIERLKELEKELNSLNTKGFAKEESEIRARLKNVSEIPEIERRLKILKSKIHGKYRPKKKRSIQNKIAEEIKEIEEDVPKIKKEIKKLDEIKSIKEDIPKIKREIKKLNEISSIKEDVPKIKKEIEKLGEKIEELNKKRKGKIDSNIDVLVDTDFESFLSDLKIGLSKKISSKEKEVDEALKSDLQKREAVFRKRYDNLLKEFTIHKKKLEENLNKKYESKIRLSKENEKEISEKLNREFEEKVDAEKSALKKRFQDSMKEHVEKEIEIRKRHLEAELKKKKARLTKQLEQRRVSARARVDEQKKEMAKRKERNLKKA